MGHEVFDFSDDGSGLGRARDQTTQARTTMIRATDSATAPDAIIWTRIMFQSHFRKYAKNESFWSEISF